MLVHVRSAAAGEASRVLWKTFPCFWHRLCVANVYECINGNRPLAVDSWQDYPSCCVPRTVAPGKVYFLSIVQHRQ